MKQLTARQVDNCRIYALMHVSEEDLRQAAFYAGHLLKKGWHSEEWQRRGTVYLQQAAFTTALVMAYTRPFTQTRSGSKLSDKVLAGFSVEQKHLHRKVMILRDRIYANTDVPTRNIRPLSINGHPTAIETLPAMRLSQEEVANIQAMIKLVRVAVAARKKELLPVVSTGDFDLPRTTAAAPASTS